MAKEVKKQKKRSNQQSCFRSVVFLGTSSAQPIPFKRNVSSLVIQLTSGNAWMVDCGEGSQHQYKISTLKIGKLRNIFITHLHGDHCYGLFGLLHSIGEGDNTITIWGPKGTKKMVNTVLHLSGGMQHYPLQINEIEFNPIFDNNTHKRGLSHNRHYNRNYHYHHHNRKKRKLEDGSSTVTAVAADQEHKSENCDTNSEVNSEVKPEMNSETISQNPWNSKIYTTDQVICLGEIEKGITAYACPITHRLQCFGYVFVENDNAGKLDGLKAKNLGAKGRQLGDLKKGNNVTLSDGSIIYAKDVLSSPKKGRKLGVMQDCWNCDSCFDIAKDCDLFIHECTYGEEHKEMAIPRGHSTAKMAAMNAVKINAKTLMLTHFSSRFVQSQNDLATHEMHETDSNNKNKNTNDESKVDGVDVGDVGDVGDGDGDGDDVGELLHTQKLQKEAEVVVEKHGSLEKTKVRCAADFMEVRFCKSGIEIQKELAIVENKKKHFTHDLTYLKLITDE